MGSRNRRGKMRWRKKPEAWSRGPYPNDVANNVFGPINVPTVSGFPVGNDDEHFDGVWPGPHILPEDLCPVSRKGKCERFPRLREVT